MSNKSSAVRPLILGSASPRRAEILTLMGIPFETVASTVDESKLDFALSTGAAVADPLSYSELMGYAPQTISAKLENTSLATFLGKDHVSIAFPKGGGVTTLHWGLLQNTDPSVEVLASAPSVKLCSTADSSCNTSGSTATNIPVAVSYKLTPANEPGGKVIYTSFHNVAQTGGDVAQILKWIILHL